MKFPYKITSYIGSPCSITYSANALLLVNLVYIKLHLTYNKKLNVIALNLYYKCDLTKNIKSY